MGKRWSIFGSKSPGFLEIAIMYFTPTIIFYSINVCAG